MAALLQWLFPPKRQPPPTVPTDTVVRLPVLENSYMMRAMVTNWSYRFDSVLDAAKLEASLTTLITKAPGWRRLGARFRLDDDDKHLTLHIPADFSSTRPAVQFTHEAHPTLPLAQHPLAATVPHSNNREHPVIVDALDEILAGPDAPTCLDDWLYSDRPALTVHVITFADATFVTLTYSHSLVDGVGKKAILTEWSKVLAGRLDEVIPLADDDPMSAIIATTHNNDDNQPYLHADKKLTGWSKLVAVFHLVVYLLCNPVRLQRNIFIPAATLARLRQAEPEPLPISDNQLLTAFLLRLATTPLLAANPTRPLAISSAVDLRAFHVSKTQTPRHYLQNLVAYTWIHLPTAQTLLQQPLGLTATQMRDLLRPQLTAPQARAAARETIAGVARDGGAASYCGSPRAFVASVSSLAKAKYWEAVDFAPAGQKGPVVWQGSSPKSGIKAPFLLVVQGRDGEGNWWAQMVVPTRVWVFLEDELKKW